MTFSFTPALRNSPARVSNSKSSNRIARGWVWVSAISQAFFAVIGRFRGFYLGPR